MKINFKNIFNLIVILFSIGLLIYFCISENGLVDLMHNITDFNRLWLSMAIICHFLNILIDAYLILKFTQNLDHKYSFKSAFKTSMVGQFFSAITPGASGGQPMQVYSMSSQGIDPGYATSALVQKFLVYQNTFTIYSALAFFFKFDLFRNSVGSIFKGLAVFGFCSQAFVIILLFLFSFNKTITYNLIKFIFHTLEKLKIIKDSEIKIRSISAQLNYFHISNRNLYKNPSLVLETYVFTAVQITCIFIVPYCIYRAFNFSGAHVSDMIAAQSFVSMVSSFMPLPGGSGVAEGGFLIFFGLFFSEQTIKSAVLLWRVITYFLTILVSFPFSRISKSISEKI